MSGAGTGSPVAAGGSTFAELINRISTHLNDDLSAEWTDAEIGTFVNAAIREYSTHFPRLVRATVTAVAGEHQYNLPGDKSGAVMHVWDEEGDDPVYYERTRLGPDFWRSDYCYALFERGDQSVQDAVIISNDFAGGEVIYLEYEAYHVLCDPAAIAGDLSVPRIHEELLTRYVLWNASVQLQMEEERAPTSGSSLLMSQYAANARRHWQAYQAALAQAIYDREGQGEMVSWHDASGGRIY